MNTWLATHPWLYPALLHLHRACVGASIALFMARGLGMAARQHWPMRGRWRHLSVAIDSLLLSAGAGLWALLGYHPLQQTWLGAKLVLLLVYIVLGSFALKRGRTRRQRLGFFIAALATVLTMAGMALARHPAGWWVLLR
ncbi:MAG: SirB2 family protein [Limnohabitans sp.]